MLLLPVVLAAALVPSVRDGYDAFWKGQPRVARTGVAGGWVVLGGARMRLVALESPTDLRGSSGRQVSLPEQVRAWRATVEFDAPQVASVQGCTIMLEAGGARYSADPVELIDMSLPFPDCAPPENSTAPAYQVVAFFVLPRGASPGAVRITIAAQLPGYARLLPP
ncbi:MAG TPA: hypothetical protein VJT31_05905 [Rugosimonospora sp.]|nr:hypothetical protein [Rugosimonospora sp.]